jgi:hypothetical protein
MGWKKGHELSFVLTAKQLPAELKPPPAALPDWANSYQTAEEEVLYAAVRAEEAVIAKSRLNIAACRRSLDGLDRLKLLFTATGSQLEEVVGEAFKELGLAVVAGPNSRADLLGSDGVRYVAIEAKGVEGTCREAYLREVGVWTAEVDLAASMAPEERAADQKAYWDCLSKLPMDTNGPESACKGILVANTFRLLPLSKRVEPDFPDAMERKIAPMGVCALTGLQLFGLVVEARQNPDVRQDILATLIRTRGVLKRNDNWKAYLVQLQPNG